MTNTYKDDEQIKAERTKYFNKIALAQFSLSAISRLYLLFTLLYGYGCFSKVLLETLGTIVLGVCSAGNYWVRYSNLWILYNQTNRRFISGRN